MMMLEIQIKLKQCNLLERYAFTSLNLAKNLEYFVSVSDDNDFSFLKLPIKDQNKYIDTVIKIITKQLDSSQQKFWIKLLFIDTVFTKCRCKLMTKELVEHLTQISSDLNSDLNKLKLEKQGKDNSFTHKLSSQIFKIKSMMNISTPKSLSFIPQTPSTSTSKQFNQEEIILKLLDYILSYERKKLQMFDFILNIRQKHQNNQLIFYQNDSFESIISSVWIIINLIKSHSMIAKAYKKIAFLSEDIKPFMIAIIFRLCRDSLMFYPYIKQAIEIGTINIKKKYDNIILQRLPKEMKKVRLEKLSKDSVFVEIDNLISELNSINETVFYLFCGKQHFMHINLEIPKEFFLNTTNRKLDQIHCILKQVHRAAEEHQKSKMYITQMVEKLDQSVERVLQKYKLRKSMTNIKKLENQEEQTDDLNIEVQQEKHVVMKRQKKKPVFFEEIIQNV